METSIYHTYDLEPAYPAQYQVYDQPNEAFLANQSQMSYSYAHSIHPQTSTTPMAQTDDVRRTRSGRPIGTQARTDSPHARTRKRAKIPAPAKSKAKKSKTQQFLPGPLSIITRDMTNVPVKDMKAWVNRTKDTRQNEARLRKGYITRPMNSFMLYRSAYADRTKAWCKENNHQVVSSVSGQSWPLEPPEVRNEFNELAKLERVNHQLAHPEYKFSPSKPKVENRKRKGEDDEDENGDGDWAQSQNPRRRVREGRDASYPARSAPALPFVEDRAYLNESFTALPPPQRYQVPRNDTEMIQYHQQPYRGNYYHQDYFVQQQQDAMLQPSSNMNYGPSQPSIYGLPGGIYGELNQLRSNATTPGGPVDGLGQQYGLSYPPPSSYHNMATQQNHNLGYGELLRTPPALVGPTPPPPSRAVEYDPMKHAPAIIAPYHPPALERINPLIDSSRIVDPEPLIKPSVEPATEPHYQSNGEEDHHHHHKSHHLVRHEMWNGDLGLAELDPQTEFERFMSEPAPANLQEEEEVVGIGEKQHIGNDKSEQEIDQNVDVDDLFGDNVVN